MSILRQPALQVLADGVPLPGVMEAEVVSGSHAAADRFSCSLALSADPAGLGGWDSGTAALITVRAGLDGGWAELVSGMMDSIDADPVRGVLHIAGRDLSAALIETGSRETFANQTASDIATLFAKRHGLAAQVTPTTTPVGRYYANDHTRVTLDRRAAARSEWDLLADLAQREGFELYVSGTTLHFELPADAGPVLMLAAGGTGSNVSALRLHRSLTLSGTITVTVKSWNSQRQAAFTQTATRIANGGREPRNYAYVHPNLAPDAALQMAQRKLATLVGHEFVLDATMPGELQLAPRATVNLVGTNSAFDQNYVVDEIRRRISPAEGFVQTIRARTGAPATTMGAD